MTQERLNEIETSEDKYRVEEITMKFVVNVLGINLANVDDIRAYRQEDGQLKSIHIEFIPDNKIQ